MSYFKYEDNEHGTTLNEEIPDYSYGLKEGEYTIDDYYALPDNRRVELINGFFYDMAAPRIVHQDIAFYIHTVLNNYVKEKKKPCKVYEAPVDVQLDCDNKTMVQPDVMVICDNDKIKNFGIYGAPDFILEILSKSTRNKDLVLKLAKYMMAGVREYWIIDPYREKLIIYDFTNEDYFPSIYPLKGKIPVAITGGDLEIDLAPVMEAIEEMKQRELEE